MKKELVLLKRGKPVIHKDISKIVKAIEEDKRNLFYTLYELFQLCEEKIEHDISFLFENVFEDMTVEIVKQVHRTGGVESLPSMIFRISGHDVFFVEEEEGFSVVCPSLSGCVTQGDTEKEAIKNAKEAIKGYLKCAQKHGVAVRQ